MALSADFTSQDYYRNPAAAIERLRALGPVVQVRFPMLGTVWATTTQALADQVGVGVLQIRRYEGGTSQPTLDVIRRLAIALGVSADMLVFDAKERAPADALRYLLATKPRRLYVLKFRGL